jgi:hypothetical protein
VSLLLREISSGPYTPHDSDGWAYVASFRGSRPIPAVICKNRPPPLFSPKICAQATVLEHRHLTPDVGTVCKALSARPHILGLVLLM